MITERQLLDQVTTDFAAFRANVREALHPFRTLGASTSEADIVEAVKEAVAIATNESEETSE